MTEFLNVTATGENLLHTWDLLHKSMNVHKILLKYDESMGNVCDSVASNSYLSAASSIAFTYELIPAIVSAMDKLRISRLEVVIS